MKALVLSSGGIDSTTCVSIAVDKYGKENVATLSAYYGQKHSKELRCAEEIAKYYGLKHIELNLSSIFSLSNCSLLIQSSEEIPEESYAEQIEKNGEGRVSTYVPFRNGLLLSTAASVADSLFPNEDCQIIYGAHADDYAGEAYADCSPEFSEALSKAINVGTYGKINLYAPLINMNKTQVVAEGLKLNTPYFLTWSCYKGGVKQCGKCGTCIDRRNAFRNNGVEDPVGYEGE